MYRTEEGEGKFYRKRGGGWWCKSLFKLNHISKYFEFSSVMNLSKSFSPATSNKLIFSTYPVILITKILVQSLTFAKYMDSDKQ